jgi:nitrite reductase/ring-hydroxylating ferredoxin subunit
MRFYPLDKLINLHDDYSCQFKIDNLQLLLIQRLAEVFLIEAHCPHRGHPLAGASIEAGYIECPLHQYQFSLKDGCPRQSTEEYCRRLRTFELVYEGNEIGVMLDEGSESYRR